MNRCRVIWCVALWALLASIPVALGAQETDARFEIPAGARASADFDAEAATRAYLATVPADAKERSDAYFEGGYWLLLWNFVVASAIYLLLLGTGWSARMRDAAERLTRWRSVHALAYWAQFTVVTALLSFPLTVYQAFFREHRYGLATQTFGAWMGDQLKALALGVILGGLFIMVLYRVLRSAPRTWWVWGSAVTVVFLMFGALISPVYIAPLFNTYSALDDPRVSGPILSMARANGIPASEVYVVDASRQTTRVSANVSGFLGTERITLNDNLLNRATLPEIQAVMGHEMGHYVLNHVYKGLLFFGVIIVAVFALLHGGSRWALGRWGGRWGVRGVDDVAGLPLLALIVGVLFFILTPVTNTIIRTQEHESDIFGLNAARQPDGMALVSLKLGEYRKLDPGHWEEILFFDHPAGRTRIHASMRWKAEHLGDAP
ncbi:MAG TPA: M48 family metallopeptidase [Longimicrobiales bacterium]|nr:M48 family metallopeptidase [Longimicrobiales bacterium]